jgi:large repetitive protein
LGTGEVTTTWEWSSSDTGGEDQWVVVATDAPGTANNVEVTRDSQRPIWIRQSDPTAASTCTATTQTKGCRGLAITYSGTGAATRVSEVHRVIGADAPATPSSELLASYTYTNGNLTKVCSPEPATGQAPLCSEYTYTTAASRTMLATMKPAGLTPWRFSYDSLGRLKDVKRERPGGGDATWSIDYNLTTTSSGLPDMSASAIAEWGQQTVPTKVYAVYAPHTGTTDVTKANLFYTAPGGLTTNTASYGPNGWLVDTGWYDTQGNLVQHLDGTGWKRVQNAPPAQRPQVAIEASSFTVYNTWGDPEVVGTRVVDEYGPAHTATLEDGFIFYNRAP